MIHHIHLGGQDRPITFAYSAAYEYELQTGKSYEIDVAELAGQIIVAGANLGTDDVGAAARTISMVKYLDIAYAALRAAHFKTKTPITFTIHDVADWFGEDKQKPHSSLKCCCLPISTWTPWRKMPTLKSRQKRP